MSDLLPLFPLPATVLFPNVFLPLHIFEPRYRLMVADAITSDRLIGMVLLRPGWEADYDGHPPVYPIGCSGVMTHVERLSDGRFNIVLRGLDRFRIAAEDHSRHYRRGTVETLRESAIGDRAALRTLRHRLEVLIAPSVESGSDVRTAPGMSDEDLVNTLSQYLELEPVERQALLEVDGTVSRAEALIELVEMKLLIARTPGGAPRVSH